MHEILEWERKLSLIREIVYEWTNLQEDLMNLRTIFEERKVQKALPDAFKLFEGISDSFFQVVLLTLLHFLHD